MLPHRYLSSITCTHWVSVFAGAGRRGLRSVRSVVVDSGADGFFRGRILKPSNTGHRAWVERESDKAVDCYDWDKLRVFQPSRPTTFPPGRQTASAKEVQVFINGDGMPTISTVRWLENLLTTYPKASVWKALRSQADAAAALQKLCKVPGLLPCNIHVMKSRTGCENAADALLTALYGRHARSDCPNFVLSNDKRWFSELPHIFPDVPTTWVKFDDLDTGEGLCEHQGTHTKDEVADTEVWRPSCWPSGWSAGTFVLARKASVSRGFRRRSSDITLLEVGERVEVLEILEVDKDDRVRGRIKWHGDSPVWISLFNTASREVWALPVCDDPKVL